MKMLLAILLCAYTVIILGCGNKVPQPASTCKLNTFIITPVNVESTLIEEPKYQSVLKAISMRVADAVKEDLENRQAFKKVILGNECTAEAIKLESKIDSLLHERGEFHAVISGKIIDCANNNILYQFKIKNARNISKLTNVMSSRISKGIIANLNCGII